MLKEKEKDVIDLANLAIKELKWKAVWTIISALFDSYHYNRDSYHMIDLCTEVRARIDNNAEVEWTDDGNVIYGILVLLYGDYGTSPRSGWIKEDKEFIKICIDDIMEDYKRDL